MFQKLNHIPSSQVVATMDVQIILIRKYCYTGEHCGPFIFIVLSQNSTNKSRQ